VLETSLLRMVKPLAVSADIGTSLRVMAIKADGKVLAESELINATGTDAPVHWRGKPEFREPTRLRFELVNAKLFAIGGVELINHKLPEPVNPLRDQAPRSVQTVRISFDHDVEDWKGVDQIEHHKDGGVKGGYISATRGKGLTPFAFLPAAAVKSPLAGDWSQQIGGRGAVISASVRTPKAAGNVKFELFAGDIAAWVYTGAKLGEGWTPVSAKLRYGWSDAEAKAAGWQPGPTAFSWAETIAHVGKVVIIHTGPRDSERVDVDEFVVTGED